MEQDKIREFTCRVTQATRTELVVITYDILLEDFRSARDSSERKEWEQYGQELKHAVRFLNELMAALDFSIPLSHDLLSLYSFVNKTVIHAQFHRDPEELKTAESVIRKLREAFTKLSAADTSDPVMQNTQQLYAGLTYGRGTLNEAYVDPNEANRGFLA